ncbi:MAG: terminase family protein [Patescibacteria group bacterium]|nr:terminase family protein [Patescibacteria group bacterium]
MLTGAKTTSSESSTKSLLLRELQLRRALWRIECRRNLLAWSIEALKPVGQTPARHHRLLIQALEDVAEGRNDRLMVLMPPGSAKSTYTSILFPAWLLAKRPNTAIIAASHTGELAEHFGRRVRNTIATNDQTLGYSLSSDNKAAGRWQTSNGGEYFAAGVGGSITGRRADLAIIDDPVKSKEAAESETDREKVWEWYKADLYTRLKPDAKIVLIMTRWHEDDLGGRLLQEMENGGDQWRVLKLPALANANDDPLGRAVDEPLWPEWEDKAALDRKRAAVGERDFGALYQQDPRPAGTSFFSIEDCLVEGQPVEPHEVNDAVFATIDTAVKTGSKNDGTAVCYWAVTRFGPHPLTLLDWEIVQIEGSLQEEWLPTIFRKLEEKVQPLRARMGSLGAFVEDKATGMVLNQIGARRGWPMRPIENALTAKGKDERAIAVSGYITSGKIKISSHAYNKMTNYKGKNGNHLLMQVFRYQIGVKDQADDLLDAFCYGGLIALGNSAGF